MWNYYTSSCWYPSSVMLPHGYNIKKEWATQTHNTSSTTKCSVSTWNTTHYPLLILLVKFHQKQRHHTSSPFNTACKIQPETKKTVFDTVDGYHAITLDKETQPLTTFITEWGKYIYLRLPQEFIASGDAYTRRYDEIIKNFPCKVKIIDDTLLYDTIHGTI